MKIQGTENEVLTNSNSESKFTINASAQAFKILSDGLYEHKVAAIVRELSCNAYDSMKSAGRHDVPFKVVIPNAVHPYFEVEDEGLGLDDAGVRDVYTSYFTSTKSDSNDSIGGFGLGSKTPFAYTTSFNIRARMDGVERLYSAYLGSDGAPCVSMITERMTDQHNGVKITVPVKSHDFQKFRYEAQFILSFFETKPEVTSDDFKFLYPNVIHQLNESRVAVVERVDNNSSLYNGTFYIVMGGVCYRVSDYFVSHVVSDPYLNDVVRRNVYGNVTFIKFDIGELEVAASRETLSLDDTTNEHLKLKIREFSKTLKEQDQRKIDEADNIFEAINHVNSVYGTGPIYSALFEYKGTNLRDWMGKDLLKGFNNIAVFYDASSTTAVNVKPARDHSGVNVSEVTRCTEVNLIYTKKRSDEREFHSVNGIRKYIRKVTPKRMRNSDKPFAICHNGPISESQLKRIEKLVNQEVNVYCYEDMKEEDRKRRKAERDARKAAGPTTPKSTGPKTKLTDSVVRATSLQIDVSSQYPPADGVFIPSQRIDVNDQNEKFYRASRVHGATLAVYGDHMEHRVLINSRDIYVLFRYFIKTEEDVTIVMENSMNESKLEKNNVPRLSDLFKEFLNDDNYEQIVYISALYEMSRSYTSSKLLDRIELYSEVGIALDGILADYKVRHNTSCSIFHELTLRRFISSDLMDGYNHDVAEKIDSITEAIEVVRKKYPLAVHAMANINSGSVHHDSELYKKMVSDAREYVKTVDSRDSEV